MVRELKFVPVARQPHTPKMYFSVTDHTGKGHLSIHKYDAMF